MLMFSRLQVSLHGRMNNFNFQGMEIKKSNFLGPDSKTVSVDDIRKYSTVIREEHSISITMGTRLI